MNDCSATSRVALEVPRVSSPPPIKAIGGSRGNRKGEKVSEEEAGESVSAVGGEFSSRGVAEEEEEEGGRSAVGNPREDEYVVQDGETLNGAALSLALLFVLRAPTQRR